MNGENEDPVNHPTHYNSHPSGIEVIEIAQGLPYLLGNVVKYVMRRDLKGNPVQDLRKAEFYIKAALESRDLATYEVPLIRKDLAAKVLAAEPNRNVRAFLRSLYGLQLNGTPWGDPQSRPQSHEDIQEALSALYLLLRSYQ